MAVVVIPFTFMICMDFRLGLSFFPSFCVGFFLSNVYFILVVPLSFWFQFQPEKHM